MGYALIDFVEETAVLFSGTGCIFWDALSAAVPRCVSLPREAARSPCARRRTMPLYRRTSP